MCVLSGADAGGSLRSGERSGLNQRGERVRPHSHRSCRRSRRSGNHLLKGQAMSGSCALRIGFVVTWLMLVSASTAFGSIEVFPIVQAASDQQFPAIDDCTVVCQDNRSGDWHPGHFPHCARGVGGSGKQKGWATTARCRKITCQTGRSHFNHLGALIPVRRQSARPKRRLIGQSWLVARFATWLGRPLVSAEPITFIFCSHPCRRAYSTALNRFSTWSFSTMLWT